MLGFSLVHWCCLDRASGLQTQIYYSKPNLLSKKVTFLYLPSFLQKDLFSSLWYFDPQETVIISGFNWHQRGLIFGESLWQSLVRPPNEKAFRVYEKDGREKIKQALRIFTYIFPVRKTVVPETTVELL